MFAKDVMKAIRDKEILLVQAGVGIGKSMGYLIPIFSSYQNISKFENIVISTSNIGLQQQLLTDIHMISKMLGIKINAAIAKGVNNYACLAKIDEMVATCDGKDKETLKDLRRDINSKSTVDRDELLEVSDRVWKQVQIKNRGACSHCNYSRFCFHKDISKEINQADIVITNHNHFAKSVLDNRDFINNADMIVFDEAHKLEDAIRNINSDIMNLEIIKKTLNYYVNNIFDHKNMQDYIVKTIHLIENFFSVVRKRGSGYFYNNNEEREIKIIDCDKIPFSVDKTENILKEINKRLDKIINQIKIYNRNMRYYSDYKVENLEKINYLFRDMLQKNQSDNIYWINFYRTNKIEIGYASRSTVDVTNKIFYRDIPIVCTSGTLLDANSSYEYFKKGLSLDEVSPIDKTIVNGHTYASPYNYDENSLFYYDTEIANPKENYDTYKVQLVDKVSELMKATNGRCLVLFTSKVSMKYVYEHLDMDQFDFDIMMQGQASNAQICQYFEKNVKSCLFATGAFWEGIDIKGKSLCNVIITRLPFANVDAITKGKAQDFKEKDAFRMVYLNDMIQKIAQGTGRLIRDGRDKGIVCCLDSRLESYINIIKQVTPFTKFTNEINDVYEFSSKNITNRDGKRGAYGPRKIKKLDKSLS